MIRTEASLVLDQATRGESGSPNIPETILSKINKSDIFLADVSFIDIKSPGSKRCPNPNVVFELGYAVHHLGCQRIILLFNKAYGSIEDLPFDFKQHRISTYELAPIPANGSKENLERTVKFGIESVFIADPIKPSQRSSEPTQKQVLHAQDTKMICWALKQMHIPTIDDHIVSAPNSIKAKTFHFLAIISLVTNKLEIHRFRPS